jgi:site-specific DNA-methyltransferase (adenine-specific)
MKNEIICGDSLEVMRGFADKEFDLCLTDPPYNAKNIGPQAKVYEGQVMQLPLEEYKKFCADWFAEARRVSKNLLFTPGIVNVCFYPQPDWIICWHKPAAVSFNRMGGYNAWEPIFFYGKMPKGKRLGQDYILMNTLNFGKRWDHPCPKPLELMRLLIDKFSLESDTVFDPFVGSGTTVVAAKELGREYVGIDLIEKYCKMTEKRLEQDLLPI